MSSPARSLSVADDTAHLARRAAVATALLFGLVTLGVVVISAESATAAAPLPGVSVGARRGGGQRRRHVDLPISLSRPGTLPVTVSYTTTDGTANRFPGTPQYDYSAAFGSVTFTPGQTAAVVRVELEDNTTIKALQFFTFNLAGAAFNATVTRAAQMVSIKPST